MKLDTSLAWSQGSATVAANKEVMVALAGVFFFLPTLAIALFFPQPQPPAGATPQQLFELLSGYYQQIAPYMLVATLVQVLGQLAVLTLTAQAGRATVGDAIRAAGRGLLPYIGVQVLLMLAGAALFALVLLVAKAFGSLALAVGLFALGAAIWAAIRLSQIPMVIAIEQQHSPLDVLRRSWALTHGHVGRILLFVTMLVLAAVVISMVATTGTGIVLTLLGGAETARIGEAVVTSLISAAFTVYATVCFAMIHRQLAGAAATDGGGLA